MKMVIFVIPAKAGIQTRNVDRLNEKAVLCSVHYSDLWERYWIQAK